MKNRQKGHEWETTKVEGYFACNDFSEPVLFAVGPQEHSKRTPHGVTPS
jgi:hypothetical protein